MKLKAMNCIGLVEPVQNAVRVYSWPNTRIVPAAASVATPNLSKMKRRMAALGIDDINALFQSIPKPIRLSALDLPPGFTEQQVEEIFRELAAQNASFYDVPSFLGGGIKPHYIPSAVNHIISRSEFYTSYTPYQPEFSQGILQAMFEYQSVVCEITGMGAANVSMYDASTALGEAARMVKRLSKRGTFFIPANIPWEKKSVLKNYTRNINLDIKELPVGPDGRIVLETAKGNDVAGIYIENPNFFGLIEERVDAVQQFKEATGALVVLGVDPLLLAIATPPVEYGADIVIGDGWLGNHLNFGGMRLGMFACKKRLLRQMPGRIIGATIDADGHRGFCMAMQTREQHIRREKATSNICSNQALCALAFVAHVALLGARGMRLLAAENMNRAQYAADKLTKLGFDMPFSGSFFNEFVAIPPIDAGILNEALLRHNIYGGLQLGGRFPGPDNALLYGITEMHSHGLIDAMIKATGTVLEKHYV
jgi:glycine dehydrogenase subunit 1